MITRALVAFPYPSAPPGGGAQYVTAAWTALGRWAYFGHAELWMLDSGKWMRATAVTKLGNAANIPGYDPKQDKGGAIYSHLGGAGQELELNPEWYAYLELPPDFETYAAKDFVLSEAAAPTNSYDWKGVFSWACLFVRPSDTAWFCSEITAAMLGLYPPYAATFGKDHRWSPNGLFRALVKLGLKPPTL